MRKDGVKHYMNARNSENVDCRLFDIKQAATYMGLGITSARQLLNDIGARIQIGARVLYDRKVIDAYFDRIRESGE